jgi:DNA repair protein RadC
MAMILREAQVTYSGRKIDASRKIACAADAARVVKGWGIAERAQECFGVLYLNAKHACVGVQTVAMGSLMDVSVHPREVFRGAVIAGAAAIILTHNHPSGDTAPSADDIRITERLKNAGELLGVPVLDHVIVTPGGDFLSLAEIGTW